MLVGAHVSSAGGLLPAIERAAGMGADILQVHTQSPRRWKPYEYSDELLASFAARLEDDASVQASVCHATYLINLATPDEVLWDRSRSCLVRNLEVASRMGAIGLVVHLGSHRGEGLESALPLIAEGLSSTLSETGDRLGAPPCPLLLENTAGAGGTIGRSFAELAAVLEAAGDDERLGICLDTQHLFASGTPFEHLEQAAGVVTGFEAAIGLERLLLVHLNDSKVPLGANRDRHENLGEGFIGTKALGSLVGHPRLSTVPAVLEVPGREHKGPGQEDIAAARALRAAGARRWRDYERRRVALTPPPRQGPLRGQGGRTSSRRDRAPAGAPSRRGRPR